jgi:HPt (histidine-containing phosphotransfer) domain-containing protein
MPPDVLKPIYSSHSEDSSDDDVVDRFVIRLAERIDVLQDAEADGDLAQLAALANELMLEADEAGFEALVSFAKSLEAACLGDDAEAARERLLDLTEIAQRIRLGHRGAA